MIYAFFYGVFLAFGLIIPLGIQNVFIFNQGANQPHFINALPSVITATLCDAILIICSVLGVSVAVLEIPWIKIVVLVIGFVFLIYMGWVNWTSKPQVLEKSIRPYSTKRQIVFSISASLLNPHAYIDTIGVIGPSSLQFTGQDKIAFVIACLFASAVWFFSLALSGHFMIKMDKNGFFLRLINKISAITVWVIASYIGWLIIKTASESIFNLT